MDRSPVKSDQMLALFTSLRDTSDPALDYSKVIGFRANSRNTKHISINFVRIFN